MSDWKPIGSAPKGKPYGPYILAYPVSGGVARVRWWDGNQGTETRWTNFIGDCGNAYFPTFWMPIPDPPTNEAGE